MHPRFAITGEKKLVGKRLEMSLAENRTTELWRSFMPYRNQIQHKINSDLISMQVYDTLYFERFNPSTKFEKWATSEVANLENISAGMETFVLPAGLYAVFDHKGTGTEIFQTIFTEWLPKSEYLLDNRPHFEVLGDKYKNGDPESEEEIWIPVKEKTKL